MGGAKTPALYRCRGYPSPADFLRETRMHFAGREAENTVLLGALHALDRERRSSAQMLAVERAGEICLAAVQTPPFKLVLSHGDPAALPCLAGWLAESAVVLPGVSGPAGLLEGLVAALREHIDIAPEPEFQLNLYSLTRLIPDTRICGSLVEASQDDLALLLDWQDGFFEETGLPHDELEEARAYLGRRLTEGEIHLWSLDGRAVSVAGVNPGGATPTFPRINFVYTPPDVRNQGYATACVTRLSRTLLERGSTCCLIFADEDNPLTNHLYRKIGYERSGRFHTVSFTGP